MPPESFIRRTSLTLASVPAASSAVIVSIFRLPRKPPSALISSAASVSPLSEAAPSTAAGPERNVMWPYFTGLSGIWPFGGSLASPRARPMTRSPAAAADAAPTVTPRRLRNSRRLTSWLTEISSFDGDRHFVDAVAPVARGLDAPARVGGSALDPVLARRLGAPVEEEALPGVAFGS